MNVLVIDDDRELCALLKDYLEPIGYSVTIEHAGLEGVERALGGEVMFQAVILDVMLPGMDGFEVLRRIRAHSGVPVLMLTARGEETDRIVGLEMGADDYLPKTFSPRELLARLRAVMRRTGAAPVSSAKPGANTASHPDEPAELIVGALRVDPGLRLAVLDDKPLKLTALEFNLLESLVRARGRVRTREHLIETLGERMYDGLDRSIDVHIVSLRRKLGDDPKNPRYIKTVRAVGYQLIMPGTTGL